jgi:ribosomal protein S18 acetylase RimI-like enzyme
LHEITITRGFPDSLRVQAASLYDAAFGAKLGIAIPDSTARLALLQQALDPAHSFAAIKGDEMVGIAGFKTSTGALTSGITPKRLMAQLGVFGAARAILVLSLFERSLAPGQLLMDGIAVSPAARGGGIGTRLLERLKEHTAEVGLKTIRLDVIDTNPDARRLYERVGFTATNTERFEYLRWLLKFSSATTLEYRVPVVA